MKVDVFDVGMVIEDSFYWVFVASNAVADVESKVGRGEIGPEFFQLGYSHGTTFPGIPVGHIFDGYKRWLRTMKR